MKLSNDMKKLLLLNSSFLIIYTYITIFVNLFIWDKSHKIADNAMYNLVMYAVLILFYTFGTKLIMKFSFRLTFGLSAIFAALSFLSLSISHFQSHLLWIASISIPIGITQGFFWSGMNTNVSLFGKGPEFINYYSISSIINQVINILLPLLSAFVIKYFGFGSSFILMFLFVSILFLSTFKIPTIFLKEVLHNDNKIFIKKEVITIVKKPGIRWIFPSNILAMFFQQFQLLFALLFTFSITDDKVLIAVLNVGYTVVCIIGLQMYKRFKRISQHTWFVTGLLLTAIGFLVALFPKAPLLVLSNVLTTLGMFYFGNIFNSNQMRLLEYETPMSKLRILVLREWAFAIGRIATFSLIYFVKDFKGPAFISMLILALIACFVIPIFQKKSIDEYTE